MGAAGKNGPWNEPRRGPRGRHRASTPSLRMLPSVIGRIGSFEQAPFTYGSGTAVPEDKLPAGSDDGNRN